jgi:hypothetical protein
VRTYFRREKCAHLISVAKNERTYFRRDVFARTLIFVGPTVRFVPPCGGGVAEGPHEEIAVAISLCAGHAQQLGGESPPLNLMEVKS